MKRSVLMFVAALALAACDSKPAETEKPAEPATAAQPETEPKAEAESQQGDKPEGAVAEAERAPMPEDLESGEQGFYGAKFTVIEEPITLADAIKQAGEAKEPTTMKVQATVSSVCKKKGCWFTMSGEGVEDDVRVRMKDYAFFVPKNSEKAKVVAEGTLTEREVPQDEAQHYADDAAEGTGKPAEKVEGPQKTWEFTATAIELQAAES